VRRYHVTTFGCQMNAHDSERIKGMLEDLGLGESATQEDADLLVFNTCTIREKPDTKFAAHLAQAAALKQDDPSKLIAVGGCYAEAQR
jgi:tRNA-2-methylthio-N6-dimethylallyladenosine synthase